MNNEGDTLGRAPFVFLTMSDGLKKSLVIQGSILAMAGLISKVIGFLYRIPMANILGNEGNGLYSVSFGIYNIALTLSSYSMPLAVSKLVSARIARGKYKNSHRIFNIAILFSLITGLIAWMALFWGSKFLAEVYQKPGLEYPLRILAPTTFVVALLGTCRGFFQGHRNMVPTAISQVIEQIVNAIVSIVAAASFVKAIGEIEATQPGLSVFLYDPDTMSVAAAGATGGTLGTFMGALVALILFVLLFMMNEKRIKKEASGDDLPDEDKRLLWKALIVTVFPIIISQSVYQLGYTLDDLIFGNLVVKVQMVSQAETTVMQGIFNTQYNQMINLPAAIATSMASATIPTIVAAFSRKDKMELKRKTDQVFKFTLLIALPAAVGLAVMAEPVMQTLFPRLGDKMDMAVLLLQTGSSAVVFYTMSTISSSVLQGCDRMWTPVFHAAVSLNIHVILLIALLCATDMNVMALIIGNVTFPLITSVMNMVSLCKRAGYSLDWKKTFILPGLAAVVMGAVTFGILCMLKALGTANIIQLVVPIIIAVPVYAAMVFALKAVSLEEAGSLPLIGKFIKRILRLFDIKKGKNKR